MVTSGPISLGAACQPDLDKERHVYEHDKQLAQITKEMQVTGIPVDTDRRAEISKQLKARVRELKWKMRDITGRFTFRPSAHADVRWALFEKFGAPVLAITGKGYPSTSTGTLRGLEERRHGGRHLRDARRAIPRGHQGEGDLRGFC